MPRQRGRLHRVRRCSSTAAILWPWAREKAGEAREPHHVAYYARDVAALWNPYVQDGRRHRILSGDAALTSARLGLALGVRLVLANSLGLLGIQAPERM